MAFTAPTEDIQTGFTAPDNERVSSGFVAPDEERQFVAPQHEQLPRSIPMGGLGTADFSTMPASPSDDLAKLNQVTSQVASNVPYRPLTDNTGDSFLPPPVSKFIAKWSLPGQAKQLIDRFAPNSQASKVAGGITDTTQDTLDFFTSPIGIMSLGVGELPVAAQRAVAGGVAAYMAKQIPDQYDQLKKAIAVGDTRQASRIASGAAINAFGTVAGGKFALKGHPTPIAPETPSEAVPPEKSPIQPAAVPPPAAPVASKPMGTLNDVIGSKLDEIKALLQQQTQPQETPNEQVQPVGQETIAPTGSNQPEGIGDIHRGLEVRQEWNGPESGGGEAQIAARVISPRPIKDPYSDTYAISLHVPKEQASLLSEENVGESLPPDIQGNVVKVKQFEGDRIPTRVELTFNNQQSAQKALDYFNKGAQNEPLPTKTQPQAGQGVLERAESGESVRPAPVREVPPNPTTETGAAPVEAGAPEPLNPGGSLASLPPELQAKSNAVKDSMKAQYEALKAQKPVKSAEDTLSSAQSIKVVPPEGATQIRVTTKDGKTAVRPLTQINKGDNPFRGVDVAKIEAGTIGKDKKFSVMAGNVQVVDKTKAPQMVGMGGAMSGESSLPTIEDQIHGNLAPERERTPPEHPTTAGTAIGAMRDVVENVKGTIGGMAGKTFPRTTLVDPRLGELGARWVSSRIAARPIAEVFASDVLGQSGIDPVEFGAALTEDNRRSIKQAFETKAAQAETPAEAQTFRDKADAIKTFVDTKNFPFKTEADYQNFLNDPATKEVINRHQDLWSNVVEPQYKQAMGIDPDMELPSRGRQTGARINLRAVQEGENPQNVVSSAARGNLLGTMRRKSPFGVQATGAAEAYHSNYYDIMENTFGRQLEIANKRAFEDALVEKGQAVIDKPGQQVMIGGKPAEPFPLRRQTIITPGGASGQNQTLYVNSKLAREYEIGANIDRKPPPPLVGFFNKLLNKTALAGLTDASTHAVNQASTLFTLPGGSGRLLQDTILSSFPGRPDFAVSVAKALWKGFQDNRAQLASLAEIGAMREHYEPTKVPVMRQMQQALEWMDKTTRLSLDDAYKRLAADGLVENSETARREFVNQIGQYNRRAQTYYKRWFRDTGLGPFVTAGTTFNTLGVRGITLNPGVRGASIPASIALRGNMLAKLVGSAATVMLANYLMTKDKKGGGVLGRPGVNLGDIDTGQTDKNGRPEVIKVFSMIGPGRGLRVTGARGFIEAKREGLPTGSALDSAARDAINSAMSPWAGPAIRFATTAVTGYPTAINVGRNTPVVPPGQSQAKENIKQAVLQANPVVAGIAKANQPGGTIADAVQSQLPRLLPQPGKSLEMMQNYPEIVRKAQAKAFIDDVISRARKMVPDVRNQFLQDSLNQLEDPADKKKAIQQFKWRNVMK